MLWQKPIWGSIAQLSRDMLQNGVSHRCACVKLSTKGVPHNLGGVQASLKKVVGFAAIVLQYRVICTWVKPGRFGSFFVLCFLALGGHCLQMLCLPGFGTHANTQNLPHFHAFTASIQEHSPPKCLFFMANAKLPNRPGFALLHGATNY